jgi:hypothetical protein
MAEPKGLYHGINCSHLKGLKIELTRQGQRLKKNFAIIGVSSKETIRTGLMAVDASPFRTVFVVREETGEVLFAISKNEEYVAAANKKKKPVPPDPPLPPASSDCCKKCRYPNGTQAPCFDIGGDACYCMNDTGGGSGGLDDELETLAF